MRIYVPKMNRPSKFYGVRHRKIQAGLIAGRPPSEARLAGFLSQLHIPHDPQRKFIFPQRLCFVDFCITKLNLVIEVDGASHGEKEQKEKDRERDALLLAQHQILVWRIKNRAALTYTLSEFEEAFWRAAEDSIGPFIAGVWRKRWESGQHFKKPKVQVIRKLLKEDWGNPTRKTI